MHLDVALRVDIPARSAAGVVTTTVRAQRAGPTALRLHAVDFEEVAVSDADGRALTWRYDGRELQVAWDTAFSAGEERRLQVRYRVVKPVAGLYFSAPDAAYPDAGTWAATDHETERARHWLPCIDLPSVRPTLAFHLTGDATHTVLANGAEGGEEVHGDGTKTVHWSLEQGCPSYLTCFAMGAFTRCDDGEHHGKPIAYFGETRRTAEDLRRTFGRTGAMLEWITAKLDDPFPYPKYFQFALPGVGGAMENISLVSWDDMLVLDETLAKEWTWQLDQINLHEMAHSWFGDHIVCRDFAHAWLKESWAVYIESCYLEDTKGADERDYDVYSNLTAYLTEADTKYMRPIATRTFDHSWSMYDRHLYPGGAVRLHMLRGLLGDDTFWAGVRDYVKRFGGKVVETDDFRKVMERHSGRSLVKWFDQWILGKGYPKIEVKFSFDAKKKEGRFEIEQTQSTAESGLPVFELSTEVGWVVDGTLHTRTVELSRAKHAVTVAMEVEPDQVRFDPHMRAVCKIAFNPGDDKLRRQLTEATDVVGRILAATELCKTGKRANIEAVRDAYRVEPFWGVRVRMAGALASANSQAAVEALAGLLEHETDGMVCDALVRSAGRFRDPLIRDALVKFLDQGPALYRARGAAWEMLGAQRDESAWQLLADAAQRPTPLGWEQQGAFRGLAASRHPDALALLLEATTYGSAPTASRHVAAGALGSVARASDRPARQRAVERLVDLLRDPNQKVQKMALNGLRMAGAVEATGAMEAWGRGLSEQERTSVHRALAAIRASAKPAASGLETQVEELRATVRKLNDRLDGLDTK